MLKKKVNPAKEEALEVRLVPNFQKELDTINKSLKESVLKTGSMEYDSDVSMFIPTGIPPLDLICGGGLPAGRIVELQGSKGSGKSSIAIQALAACQAAGGLAMLIDTENAHNRERSAYLGIDENNSRWIYAQPNTLEVGFKFLVSCINKIGAGEGAFAGIPFAVIVWDTIAFTPLEDEYKGVLDGEDIKPAMGRRAVYMRSMVRNLLSSLKNSKKVCFLSINHITQRIGGYGPTTEAPGGTGFQFGSSLMLKVAAKDKLEEDKYRVGHIASVSVEKSRFSMAKQEADLRFFYVSGVNAPLSTLDYIKEHQTIPREGNRLLFEYKGTTIPITTGGSGEEAFLGLWEDPEIRAEIVRLMTEQYESKFMPWKTKKK